MLPASIIEGSLPGDWTASLSLAGDIGGLQSIEAIGPQGLFFAVAYDPALALATLRPAARLDYEAFAGPVPQAAFTLRFNFTDGSHLDDTTPFRVTVLDRDDTPPTALRFASGGSVTAGAIGSIIGTLLVTDPDSAGPFHFTFPEEDAWRFEVVGNVLKLRDGISLGLDDMPSRPLFIQVSDGQQSAGFTLDLTVRDPAAQQSSVQLLGPGETRAGFTQTAPDQVLALHGVQQAAAVNLCGGEIRQVVLQGGEEIWLGPVQRLQFADGWLDFAPDGLAARAASLHRAVLGQEATGAELAREVGLLQSGAAWVELAQSLLTGAGALDDAGFAAALHQAACGRAADAAELELLAGRLASGTSRAQLAVDVALGAEAMAELAAARPDGLWVFQPFGRDAAAAGPDPGGLPGMGGPAAPDAAAAIEMGWFL
ncbi:DUF4214 domain-containing protein [Siccirubricoccus sp. G192]|uniref:DUF4214 domain-containing protein n=1 Tax=Siccirubricoccus sp. G192 TaxID=2849651 RepID=UPI001C2C8435|nr:DUF4214 domain-containing protein [Siccirubricoccus sp. G192]MBV1797055.1 DUF4214 domain-containing protein [Siccirubricoccus sp. G192]